MRTFHIITFGCQMNEHDSERMSGILESQGFVPTEAPEQAEMVILNTCSIREKAEQKFYSELGRLALIKNGFGARPSLVVAGCIAQQDGAAILTRVPAVDLVIGPSDISRLSDLVAKRNEGGSRRAETAGDPEYHRRIIPASRKAGIKAWVSIMYGCDNFCSYCVVPHLRGRERSRPAADIAAEVAELAGRGFREVTLLGQNVNSYGKGLERRTSFPELLRLVHGIQGLKRIRFVTSHPRDLSDDLIEAIRELPKVCEAIHLPVQCGSDRVLAAMNRRYTRRDFEDRVRKLRAANPDMALTTDIIVGFPGETDEDHAQTIDLIRSMRFDNLFAFKYSKRPNTKALDLSGHLSEELKDRRLAEVFELQRGITLEKNREHIGTVQEVLVEGGSKRGGKLAGRTRGNKVVNFPGPSALVGSCVRVTIISASQNSLSGSLCE